MDRYERWGSRNLEARGGFEPPIKVLQTFALPLGYRAPDVIAFYQMIDGTAGSNLIAVSKKKAREATFRLPHSCQTVTSNG